MVNRQGNDRVHEEVRVEIVREGELELRPHTQNGESHHDGERSITDSMHIGGAHPAQGRDGTDAHERQHSTENERAKSRPEGQLNIGHEGANHIVLGQEGAELVKE